MDDDIRRHIKLMVVEANSRTIPRAPSDFLNVPPEIWAVLRDVEALHSRGEFASAAKLIAESLPEEAFFDNAWVTNAMGLSLSQDGREPEAWPFFARSEQLGLAMAASAHSVEGARQGFERAARAATNLSISLKKYSKYPEAIVVAERATGHASWFWPAYTALVAALESRGTDADKERALNVLDDLVSHCSRALEDEELYNALERDIDYARIRALGAHLRFKPKREGL